MTRTEQIPATGATLRRSLMGVVMAIAAMLSFVACNQETRTTGVTVQADSMMNAVYKARDYEQLLTLADKLERQGALSPMKASYWRGYACSRLKRKRMAESHWKKALASEVKTDEDMKYYAMSASRLSSLLLLQTNYESTLRLCVPALKMMEEKGYDNSTDYASLLTAVASCQLRLGNPKEAASIFAKAYQKYLQVLNESDSIANYTNAIVGMITTTDNYLLLDYAEEAYTWTGHFDELLKRYREHPQADSAFIDKQWARLNFYRSCALEGLGRSQEAAKAYQEACKTKYAKTGDGLIEATNYLMSAHRWAEAANNFTILEAQVHQHDISMTLDNIQVYLLAKFRANIEAHRTDSALAAAVWICNSLDSAIVFQKNDVAAELATIYETQEKEAQIAQQQADISKQHMVTTVIVSLLVIVFFAVYIFIRRRSALRLKAANDQLEHTNEQLERSNEQLTIANARAEESSKMKTNFIQQISHEIRTPLNILSGFTQIITTPGMQLDEATQQDINRQITENTNRITNLVKKMLELSDASSSAVIERTDTVPALQIAAQATEDSGISTAKHLDFDLQLPAEAETVMLTTNLQAATRALTLLLDNARKFTRAAEATGETESGERKSAVLRLSIQDNNISFSVEDTGIGVPASEAEHIFEEFVQLNDYYDGTGIGLTVARSLARRLGGNIVLDPGYGPGARFVMTLPLNPQPSQDTQ